MTSEFVYNGTSKKLKVTSVNPSKLALLFKLEDISLTDDEGEIYIPEGDQFDPKLIEGTTYTIEGTAKQAAPAQSKPQPVAVVDSKKMREVRVLQEKERDKQLEAIIYTCKNMNASAGMLYAGPHTVCLMESISILTACANIDPSLVAPGITYPSNRLTNPNSFRACVLQLLIEMSNTFRQANISMETIKAELSCMPDIFVDLIELSGQPSDENVKRMLEYTLDRISRTSGKCQEMAIKSVNEFKSVLDLNDELVTKSNDAIVFNSQNKAAVKKQIEENNIKKANREKLAAQYEKDKADALARAERARDVLHAELAKGLPPSTKTVTESRKEWHGWWIFGSYKAVTETKAVDNSHEVNAEMEKRRQYAKEFESMRAEEQRVKDKLEQTQKEMNSFVGELKMLNFKATDLTEIIIYLNQGMNILSNMKEEWGIISDFFNKVKINIDTILELTKSIQKKTQEHIMIGFLRDCLQIICYCVQVSNVADLYVTISDKYVMPSLGGMGKTLTLDKTQAQNKIKALGENYRQKEGLIKDIIATQQKELDKRAKEQVKDFAEVLEKAYLLSEADKQKAIGDDQQNAIDDPEQHNEEPIIEEPED